MKFAQICTAIASVAMVNLPTTAVARELPDLVVESARLKATGTCTAGKLVVAGTVRVRNAGRGRGQIFTTYEMLSADAPRIPGLAGVARFVNSMRPGEVQTVNLTLRAARPVKADGPATIVITVDPRNVFNEADEGNNALKVKVAVDCK
jgi:hypothetical protein